MKTFTFTLGNTTMRKGHRHDCAQIEVQIEIKAHDESMARRMLARGEGRIVSWAVGEKTALSTAVAHASPSTCEMNSRKHL